MARTPSDFAVAGAIAVVGLITSWLALVSHRPTAAVLALLTATACWWLTKRRRWAAAAVAVIFSAFLSPVDLSFYRSSAGPRMLPLVMGLLKSPDTGETLDRGVHDGFVAGGDVTTGLEPQWIIVW